MPCLTFRHLQMRVRRERVRGVVGRPRRVERRDDEVVAEVVSRIRCDPLERDQPEADRPVEDLHEGDDRYPGKETERASDGGNHVEDAGPELEGDSGDDWRVVVKVEDGDVASEAFSG